MLFFKNVTLIVFFPQITMPTRLSDNSNTLIDNTFTNNICKPHDLATYFRDVVQVDGP